MQLMEQLPQERLIIAVGSIAMIERALAVTIDYVKERKAFGKPIIDFQNTSVQARRVQDRGDGRARLRQSLRRAAPRSGKLDAATASMAKYWITDLQGKIVDECLQLHGGYGYMDEYPIARMYTRRPRAAHLRRHQRDHEDADRAHAVSVGAIAAA